MKFLRVLSLGLVLAASSLTASANDYDDFDQFATVISSSNPTFSSSFNIRVDDGDGLGTVGFDSSVETVIWAEADFTFRDNDALESKVTITLGPDAFATGALVGNNQTDINGSTVNLVFTLNNSNGEIDYVIQWAGGDSFRFTGASLTVKTAPRVTVADGGFTLALLGASMLGVFGLRRRVTA